MAEGWILVLAELSRRRPTLFQQAWFSVSVQIVEDERGPVANIVLVTFETFLNPQERVMELRKRLALGVGLSDSEP